MGNVDDKPIPPEFLSKKPKITWESEGTGMARVELNLLSSGDSAVLYTIKYMLKGQPTRACKGDYLLAVLSHLEPENAVTTGVFTKIYNMTVKFI